MSLSLLKKMLGQSPLWSIWLVFLLISSIWVALYVHQFFDYGFSIWYHLLDIHQHIQFFAPQNYYKDDFAQLTHDIYIDLFSQISWAVNHGGAGLADIRYTIGNETRLLLRQPEVIHLQDVADLIDRVNIFGILAVITLGGLTSILIRREVTFSWVAVVSQLLAIISLLVISLFIIGPKTVFYWLHIALFPAENQWFFYYQESLMATLMKAPDLFAGIAASVAVLAIGLLIMTCLAIFYWFKHRVRHSNQNGAAI